MDAGNAQYQRRTHDRHNLNSGKEHDTVLSTDSDLFKFLKGMTPNGEVVPAQRSGDNR
jgi:hypothetical protein